MPKWVTGWNKTKNTNDRQPNLRRRFHLGLDWGTSSTKMVLRDLNHRSEEGGAYVLTPPGCEKGSYRYPSVVAIHKNKFYCGSEAERFNAQEANFLYSLKSKVISPDFIKKRPEWKGLSEYDFATLFLTHLIKIGLEKAQILARQMGTEPVVALTLGVPAAELEQENIWQIYFEMIRLARILAIDMEVDPQAEKLDDAITALKMAQRRDEDKQAETVNVKKPHLQYLRPEVAAAMYWSIRSPVIEPGLYSCVDIGAWTTNAAFYRLADRHLDEGYSVSKDRISFYGAKCRPPGMDKVCKLLAEAIDEKNYINIRGREASLLTTIASERIIDQAVDSFCDTWKKAFQLSYPKERSQSRWEKLNVMVIGGGSKVPAIKKQFQKFPHGNWTPPKMTPDLGAPKDLYEFPEGKTRKDIPFEGDPTFLLVAYGLSVPAHEFPDVRLQDMVPDWTPFKRKRRQISHEEIYTD